jgi:hypothetical protein
MNREQHLLRAAHRILRPLVRILLRNGIASDAFTELARKVYVDIADEEFRLPGKKQTVSRIAVITGLNRKEVTRLRKIDPLDRSDELWRNRAATVLSAWILEPPFQDRKGDPLDLPFAGTSPSFTDLVKRFSGDMQPRAIADELLRLGSIETIEGKYRMTTRVYIPSGDPEAIIDILGTDTSELMETIDHNSQANGEDTLFQAKVLYDNVPEEHLAEFDEYSRRLARHALLELNEWLMRKDRGADRSEQGRTLTLGLGVYQIARENPDDTNDKPNSESLDGE